MPKRDKEYVNFWRSYETYLAVKMHFTSSDSTAVFCWAAVHLNKSTMNIYYYATRLPLPGRNTSK